MKINYQILDKITPEQWSQQRFTGVAEKNQNAISFVPRVFRIAQELRSTMFVNPVLLCAQWAVESNWGCKTTGNFNYWGIKARTEALQGPYWKVTDKICVPTKEHIHGEDVEIEDWFCSYPDEETAIRDYFWLIQHNYPKVATMGVEGLLCGTYGAYATSPSYIHLVTTLQKQFTRVFEKLGILEQPAVE